ncbi:MAG TPA: IS1595 family transposase [Terriglobales bacterium]|nr:IS1595 family transposase [Terriglobales bacterium]
MKPKMERYTIERFNREFPDDAACLEWLKNRIYPDGIHCETCEAITNHYRVASRPSYSCQSCGNHVHPTAGTIFHKSSTSLRTWFYAVYLMSATRCGVSAKQIERETGVTYKTAWRMFKQIRSMLADESPLGGKVEMDECEIGAYVGREGGRKGRALKPRATVFGAVERGGRVKAVVAPDRLRTTIRPLIKRYVLPKSTVFTDQFVAYDGLIGRGYRHYRINHSAGIYVDGDVHTQTIEGFWNLVKGGISGVYHSVSHKYLQTYLDEYSFRYSHRKDIQPMFISFLEQVRKSDVKPSASQTESHPF